MAQKRFKAAQSGLEQAIMRFPNDAGLHELQGDVYEELLLPDRAIQEFSAAIRLDPLNDGALIKKGKSLETLSKTVEALLTLTEATRLNPLGSAYGERAMLLRQHYRDGAAVRDFTRAIEQSDSIATNLSNRGSVYERCGEINKAIQDYSAVLALKPMRPTTLRQRGKLLIEKGEFQLAWRDADRAVRAEPEAPINYIFRAKANLNIGRYKAANDDYSIALKLAPSADTYRCRAAVRKLLHDEAGYLEDIKKAKSIDNQPEDIHFYPKSKKR